MPVVRGIWVVLIALLMAACARSTQAQVERLPELSQIEPLPQAESQMIGPELVGPEQGYFDFDSWMATSAGPTVYKPDWDWQILPDGIIYQSYLANPKASRMGTQIFHLDGDGTMWDSTLGGHFGLLRYGTCDGFWPQGWQLDVEGGVNVRLNPEENRDLDGADFRIGPPLTYG